MTESLRRGWNGAIVACWRMIRKVFVILVNSEHIDYTAYSSRVMLGSFSEKYQIISFMGLVLLRSSRLLRSRVVSLWTFLFGSSHVHCLMYIFCSCAMQSIWSAVLDDYKWCPWSSWCVLEKCWSRSFDDRKQKNLGAVCFVPWNTGLGYNCNIYQ
jgi:hypothetical protein